MSIRQPLTNEELFNQAPSIFAQTEIDGLSDRYAFVPTYKIIDTFREAGYFPILSGESRVRKEENEGYQKHFIQFRSLDNLLRPNASQEYADIILVNDHSGKSSFKVILSYWRTICQNMLLVPSHTFVSTSIIHSGFQDNKIQRAIEEVTEYMPKMEEEIETFKSITLSPIEQYALAKAAIDLRFDTNKHQVDPHELLKIHRQEDSETSLWVIFNRIQEGIIRGGVKGKNLETNRNFTSKPINAIDANFSLNQELWSTVKLMADFKTSALPMAA